jgi:hypothetical protein
MMEMDVIGVGEGKMVIERETRSIDIELMIFSRLVQKCNSDSHFSSGRIPSI